MPCNREESTLFQHTCKNELKAEHKAYDQPDARRSLFDLHSGSRTLVVAHGRRSPLASTDDGNERAKIAVCSRPNQPGG